ncbi:MAG: type II toxin-antitoxin system RelE family toxin [Candidatus Saliniplasma sp.]
MTSDDYSFEVKPRFIEKLDDFPKDIQKRIKDKLKEFQQKTNTYGIDPREHNNTKYIATDKVWRLRVGDYRVFFDIYDKTVSILYVEHRKKAYK